MAMEPFPDAYSKMVNLICLNQNDQPPFPLLKLKMHLYDKDQKEINDLCWVTPDISDTGFL